VTPNTDSPRIPHDKVTKVTDSCHKTLSESHHHSPAESFKSSLGHCTNVALTRVNSQSHCRSRGLAQHPHNIAGATSARVGRSRPRAQSKKPRSEEGSLRPARCRGTRLPPRSPHRHRKRPCWRWGTRLGAQRDRTLGPDVRHGDVIAAQQTCQVLPDPRQQCRHRLGPLHPDLAVRQAQCMPGHPVVAEQFGG
jgi:hypothetical protein